MDSKEPYFPDQTTGQLSILCCERLRWVIHFALIRNRYQLAWRRDQMKKYLCDICSYVYDPAKGDPENGVNPGTAFEDLPDDWVCPECDVGKEEFSPEE